MIGKKIFVLSFAFSIACFSHSMAQTKTQETPPPAIDTNYIKDLYKEAGSEIKEGGKEVYEDIKESGKDLYKEAKEKGKDFYEEAKEEARESFEDIKEKIAETAPIEDSTFGVKKRIPRKYKKLAKADSAFVGHRYHKALTLYQKAFTKIPKTDKVSANRIIFRIAQCYHFSGQSKRAVSQYKRAIRIKYDEIEPKCHFYLAELLRLEGKFEEAISVYDQYLSLVPDDSIAIENKRICFQTPEILQVASRYEIENQKKLNQNGNDWSPRLYNDAGDILVFTSIREGVTGKKLDEWTGERFSDLFLSKKDQKGDWSKPELLDANGKIASSANESDACFCNNGSTVYYTICHNKQNRVNRCVIYTSQFDGSNWGDPVEVQIGNDTISDFIHPHITPDGKKIFFSSNKASGEGDLDIWYAEGSGSSFENAVNMGKSINSPARESFPFYRNDSTLYFSSDRKGGLGGYDIYVAKKQGEEWVIENMGHPINSNSDDFSIMYYPNQNKGYFSSNRPGGRKGDDIWSFYLPDILFTISGSIRNDLNMQPLNDVSVQLSGSDGMTMRTLSNSKGFYQFDASQIQKDVTYEIRISKKGFYEAQATESTLGLNSSKDFIRDFAISPLPKGPVVLPDILYQTGKWDLQEKFQDSLMVLITFLEKNPRTVVELASHTDNRPIAMTNDSLSQYRAQAVVDYLVIRGIHPERLIAKGYGSQVPRSITKKTISIIEGKPYSFDSGVILSPEYIRVITNKKQEEAAHQLNRRTEFSVLRDDFIPSDKHELGNLVQLGDASKQTQFSYTLNPDQLPELEIIVNGVSLQVSYQEKARRSKISTETLLRLLELGKISKYDFENKEKAFTEEGGVLRGQVVKLKDCKLSNHIKTKNIELLSEEELGSDIILNKADFSKFGKFRFDTQEQIIIFEKP